MLVMPQPEGPKMTISSPELISHVTSSTAGRDIPENVSVAWSN